MPFPNVPKHLTAKMDRCVSKVQSGGAFSKPQAIATCFNSVVKELADENDGVLADLFLPAMAELAASYAEDDILSKDLSERAALTSTIETAFNGQVDQLIDAGVMQSSQRDIFAEDLREHLLEIAADTKTQPAVEVEPAEEAEKEKPVSTKEPVTEENARSRRRNKRAAEREADGKHYNGEVAVEAFQPFGGSETWDDLDEYLDAEDQKDAVRIATFEFERLQTNVLNNPEHTLKEKSTLIGALADGLADRSEDIQEGKEVDEVEESESWIDKIRSTLKQGKRVTKREDGVNLIASDFADVPDRTKPSTWKLRLAENRSGHFTLVQVGRAITAMQPSGFRGQRVKIGSSKASVVSKISAAINKIKGATDEQKRNMRKRLTAVKAAENSGFRIFKDAEGDWRWFGWATNKWRDRDSHADPLHGGEILTEAAHQEFIVWVDKNPARRTPALWPWHTKEGAHEQRADWMDYADGFLCLSGPLSAEEAKAITRVANEFDLGMSHGFYAISRDRKNGHITKYRAFEVSYLPLEDAANPWTDFVTIEKEVDEMGFSDSKRRMLALLAGEEFTAEVESETAAKAEMLEQAGIDSKGKNVEAPAEEPAEEAAPAEEAEEEAEPETAAAIAAGEPEAEATEESEEKDAEFLSREEAGEAFNLMTDMIVGLGDKIDTLAASDAEKIEEVVEKTPRASLAEIIAQRASGSEETLVDGRTVLAKSKPKEAESNADERTGIGVLDQLMQMNVDKAEALRQ